MSDPVNHPKHYTNHPSGVEAITITEHMGFCVGNAIKYLWRADLKADPIEDLRKAAWYINREIARRTKPAYPVEYGDPSLGWSRNPALPMTHTNDASPPPAGWENGTNVR